MPPRRRFTGTDSETRARLVDAAERLLLRDGYAAVTSRRVAQEAGSNPQLVHYYFRTMDDLYLEVYRRRAEEGLATFERAVAEDRSLRAIWAFGGGARAARFNLEFAALANHRKAIRAEIARYAERFRRMQLEAIEGVLAERTDLPRSVPAEVVLVVMTGVTQVMGMEEALGVDTAHQVTLSFVEDLLDELEPRGAP